MKKKQKQRTELLQWQWQWQWDFSIVRQMEIKSLSKLLFHFHQFHTLIFCMLYQAILQIIRIVAKRSFLIYK